jgi:LysR family transcriptional regulator, glycine cleavage system transcriptional activator
MADDRSRVPAPATNVPSRKSLPPFESLRAFDAIARLGGVRRAAQYLLRDHAVVSRHLRTLEDWTGAKLIERTPAGVVLTDDGRRYHKHIAAAMDTIAEGTIELMRRGDSKRLYIRCMPAFALHWLSRRLGEFERANPGIDIEVKPADRSPDVPTHGTDVEIRFVPTYGAPFELPPAVRSIEIATVPVVAVASPAYLAASTPIAQPTDLLRQRLLHEENFDRWAAWLAAHGVHEDVDLTGPRLWQGHLTLDAARHGLGIALSNHLVAVEDLTSGRLVDVGAGKPAFRPHALGTYHLIARADSWEAPVIHRFREWQLASVAKELPRLGALS